MECEKTIPFRLLLTNELQDPTLSSHIAYAEGKYQALKLKLLERVFPKL